MPRHLTTDPAVPDLRLTVIPRLNLDANGDPSERVCDDPFSTCLVNILHKHDYRPFIDAYSRSDPQRLRHLYAPSAHRALQFKGNAVRVWQITELPTPPAASDVRAASWIPDLLIYYNTENQEALSAHLWRQVLSYFCSLLKPVLFTEAPDDVWNMCIMDYGKTPGTDVPAEVFIPAVPRTTRRVHAWIKPPTVCPLIPLDAPWPPVENAASLVVVEPVEPVEPVPHPPFLDVEIVSDTSDADLPHV